MFIENKKERNVSSRILTITLKGYAQKPIDPLGLWFYQAQLAGKF